ncbi:hypothetical protein CYY_000470 [Polysphondylium violaceum]|uniref:Cytoplasmic tRNA 2-thiolation protein 2 n=1 Tax=Polysphondylium violaceum TaxID=133409 RepID=A0A8J4V2C6_9MYCE|nr:hypothetical protein CYY_000470 [Polysphondylium violaceum]
MSLLDSIQSIVFNSKSINRVSINSAQCTKIDCHLSHSDGGNKSSAIGLLYVWYMSTHEEELPSCGSNDNDVNNTVPQSTRRSQLNLQDNTKCAKCVFNIINNTTKQKEKEKKEKKQQQKKKGSADDTAAAAAVTAVEEQPQVSEIIESAKDAIGKPIVHFRSESLCWECYKDLMLKKFRTNIVKARESKREAEKLLIALSGGTCSMVVAELLRQCIDGLGKSKMFFDIQCVHVDESLLYPYYQYQETLEYLRELTASFGFPFHVVPLENIYGTDPSTAESRRSRLIDSFKNVSSNTSKEDMIVYYREHLLSQTAHTLGCNKVVLGTSSNRLASKLVASTSKGRGFTVPNETSVVIEQPTNNIKFYQPLRDLLLKEIYIYYRHLRLREAPVIHPFTETKPKNSINTLCDDFLHCLQDISNQTVHTLLRSVDKLISPSVNSEFICSMCLSPLTSTEINAIESKKNSNNSSASSNSNECCSTNNSKSDQCCSTTSTSTTNGGCCSSDNNNNNSNNNSNNNLVQTLCYSCRILYGDIKQKESLAPYVKENSKTLLTTNQLKNEIKDFLLEDDQDEDEDEGETK